MTTMRDKDLDELLALAATDRPAPDQDLMDRVLADALAAQERPVPQTPQPPRRAGLLERLSLALGGRAVLAGVTSSLILGLAVGYLSPTTLDYLTGGSSEAVELFPDTDFLTTEG
jgi:hypothetical protein